jgi:hypothetical protein
MLNTLIQIIAAIIIIIILGIIAYSVYNSEITRFITEISSFVIIKKPVNIFKGIMPLNSNVKPSYTTFDKSSGTFKDLKPSINQKGGAEYSYNFWIHNNRLESSIKNITNVLFLRGNNNMIQYTSKNNCITQPNKKWFLSKNPLMRVYINNNSQLESIITEFNSITNPDAFHINSDSPNCNSDNHEELYSNHLGIFGISKRSDLNDKWIMITLVVKETNPDTNILFRNKAVVKMYLNGFEQLNKNADVEYNGSTAMKHNEGNLYINPGNSKENNNITDNSGLQIADLTYYNYALTKDEIVSLHSNGITKGQALIPNDFSFNSKNSTEAVLETNASNYIKEY